MVSSDLRSLSVTKIVFFSQFFFIHSVYKLRFLYVSYMTTICSPSLSLEEVIHHTRHEFFFYNMLNSWLKTQTIAVTINFLFLLTTNYTRNEMSFVSNHAIPENLTILHFSVIPPILGKCSVEYFWWHLCTKHFILFNPTSDKNKIEIKEHSEHASFFSTPLLPIWPCVVIV